MNDKRRRKLEDADILLSRAKDVVEEVLDEEQNAYDSLPESLTYSDRAQAMEEAIENLDSALASIEEAQAAVEEAKG